MGNEERLVNLIGKFERREMFLATIMKLLIFQQIRGNLDAEAGNILKF